MRRSWNVLVVGALVTLVAVTLPAQASAQERRALVLQAGATQYVEGGWSAYRIPGVANVVEVAPVSSINDRTTEPLPTGRLVVKMNGTTLYDAPIRGWSTTMIVDPLPAGDNDLYMKFFGDAFYPPAERSMVIQASKSGPGYFNFLHGCPGDQPRPDKECLTNVLPNQAAFVDAHYDGGNKPYYMPWPTGSATFTLESTNKRLASVPFVNGRATFDAYGLPSGRQCIRIEWPGDGTYRAAQPASQCFWVNAPGESPASTLALPKGYRLVAADSTISEHGADPFVGKPYEALTGPIVGSATYPSRRSGWSVTARGDIFPYGSARSHGSTGAMRLNKPIVGMASTPSGAGYWLVASDGGIFAFGDARFHGSTGAMRLNQPIVGMASTPSGQGYWLVASDGGIFAYGDARFYGSTGSIKLNKPVVGMAAAPSGDGYWLVASDGGIFAFGTSTFVGSTGSIRLNKPVVAMTPTRTGYGYWLVASDGGVFSFGDATFAGSGVGRTGAPFASITNDT